MPPSMRLRPPCLGVRRYARARARRVCVERDDDPVRCVEQQQTVTPPSIAIEAPVLGGPESVRVCVSQQQHPVNSS